MKLELLDARFTICKTTDLCSVSNTIPFCFTACTDEECSIVCPEQYAPEVCLAREDGWRAFRIAGVLDFSLVGILARIAELLAREGIPIYALSTYNTDYILIKQEKLCLAVYTLEKEGYIFT